MQHGKVSCSLWEARPCYIAESGALIPFWGTSFYPYLVSDCHDVAQPQNTAFVGPRRAVCVPVDPWKTNPFHLPTVLAFSKGFHL